MRWIFLASACCVVSATPVWAQQSSSPAADDRSVAEGAAGTDGEILVTARRTVEKLRDVPLAVTALGNEALAAQGIVTVSDLARVSPGLSVSPPNTDPYSPVVSLRGQVQNDITLLALDTSVGFYVDDFYISRPNALTAYGTYDLERVEVSRGPQGTLFGRNATGGNVRYITKKAGNEFEGYVRAGIANFKHREFEGAINLPVVKDVLAIRLAGNIAREDGWQRSLANGSKWGDVDSNSYRANVMFTPGDRVKLDLSWNHFKGSGGNQASVATFINAGVASIPTNSAAAALAPTLTDTNQSAVPHFANAINNLYTAALAVDLSDNIQFNAIYGRMEIDVDQQFDLLPLGPVGVPLQTYIDSKQDSVEGRFSGKLFGGRLNWQAGVFYLKENGNTDLIQDTLPAGVGAASNLRVEPINTASNRSLGFFGQGTYELTPQLKLTLGIRNTDERRVGTTSQFTTIKALGVTRCGLNTNPASPTNLNSLLIAPCVAQGTVDHNYWSYLASIDFKPSDDHLMYIKTAKSYRAGGFNARGTALDTFKPFDAESVTEYEVGYKGRLFDRLNLGIAGFVDQRRNGQQSVIVVSPQTGSTITLIGNNINADIWGLEVEASLKISEFLTLNGMYTHLSKRLQLSPTSRLNIGATVDVPVGSGALSASANYSWQSDFDGITAGCTLGVDLRNCTAGVNSVQQYNPAVNNVPSYGLFNARIAYRLDNPNIELAVFGRNIGNKFYYGFKFDGRNGGGGIGYPGAPRTYGAEVTFRF
jgi:iron complex outermembrane recepter protein